MKTRLLSLLLLGAITLFSLAAVDAPESPTAPPQRPTPNPPSPANDSVTKPNGGQILLQTAVDDVTVGRWTVIQWQDPSTKEWHNVDGWRGHFNEDSQVIWWVGKENLGSGPFRWLVYSDETESDLLLISESFALPAHSGERVTIAIDLP